MKRLFTRAASLLIVGTLTIASSALAQPASDSDAAKTKPPIAHLTVAKSIGFGTVKAITIKPIVLTNTGTIDANVTVTGPSQPSPFTVIAGGGSYSLGPGQEQVISVQFLPIGKGPVKQAITIQCNNCSPASDNNLTIHLSGNANGAVAKNALPFSVRRLNASVVSITVCATGTPNCKVVNDMIVNTGSSGVQIFGSQLSGLGIIPNTDGGGQIGECFFAGTDFTWGAVSTVDVKIAGEPTITVPIHVMDDINAFPPAPSTCTQGYQLDSSPSQFGANGVLGVGQALNDLHEVPLHHYDYFQCSAGDCSLLNNPPNEDVVPNPVSSFPVDNNGVVLSLPAIPANGQKTTNGTLYFGIGTESNNQPGQVTTYRQNSDTNSKNYLTINTVYQGISAPGFFDSGGPAYFFSSSIQLCSNGVYYCPAKTLSESATNESVDGAVSGVVNFKVANFDKMFSSNKAAFNDLGLNFDGGTTYDGFVWGLPFFFGRTVYLGIDGSSSPLGTGPYIAY
jgi:Protein of unknown function (DUF3443)